MFLPGLWYAVSWGKGGCRAGIRKTWTHGRSFAFSGFIFDVIKTSTRLVDKCPKVSLQNKKWTSWHIGQWEAFFLIYVWCLVGSFSFDVQYMFLSFNAQKHLNYEDTLVLLLLYIWDYPFPIFINTIWSKTKLRSRGLNNHCTWYCPCNILGQIACFVSIKLGVNFVITNGCHHKNVFDNKVLFNNNIINVIKSKNLKKALNIYRK